MVPLSQMKTLQTIKGPGWISLLFAVLFIVQFCFCAYFNLFLLESRMGFDSSWAYLKPVLIWREGTLFSDTWIDQTGAYLDSSILPATLFYGLFGNPFLAYGLANLLILCLILYYAYVVCRNMGVDTAPTLLCLNLLICPYMTQGLDTDLGYFSCVIGAAAFYNGRMLLCLMALAVTTRPSAMTSRIYVRIALSLVLCLLSGVSVGLFMVVVLFAPMLLFYVFEALKSGRLRNLLSDKIIFLALCIMLVLAGKMLANYVFHSPISDNKTWTSITDLGVNILAVIQGILKLVNALPVTTPSYPIFSTAGIKWLFPLAILAAEICAIGYALKTMAKSTEYEKERMALLLVLVIWNLIVFSLFNVQYGSLLFEERYLICSYAFVILLTALFLEQLKSLKLLWQSLMLSLCIALCCLNFVSDRAYINADSSIYSEAKQIVEILQRSDVGLTYVWAPEKDIDSVKMERDMRVLDLDHIYKALNGLPYSHKGREGDYRIYDDPDDYLGKTAFVTNDTDAHLPQEIIKSCTLYDKVGDYEIYICDTNPLANIAKSQE